MHQDQSLDRSTISGTHLTTKILDFDPAALERHHEAGLELNLSATRLRIVEQQAQLAHKVSEDVCGSGARFERT